MNRRVILLGAGVVVIVAIVLAIKVRSSDSGTTNVPAPDQSSDDRGTRRPTTVPADHVAQAGTDSPAKQSDPKDYVETEINGIRVRDHRKNPDHPVDLPPAVHPSSQRLPSTLVSAISDKMQAVMGDCTKTQLAPENRGKKPLLEGVIYVDVKSGTMKVTESTVQLRDVEGDTAAIKQCFEQKSVGQSVPSGKTEDATHYAITLNYQIPK